MEANKGLVSALAFSPDGLKLAAGDVSYFRYFYLFYRAAFTLYFCYPCANPCTCIPVQSSGKVVLYDVPKREPITSRWSFHSARVNALSWTADSQHCASGALDTHVYVWSVRKPMKNIAMKNAVPGGVNAVLWLSSSRTDGTSTRGRLAGTGADAAIKVWEVTFHA